MNAALQEAAEEVEGVPLFTAIDEEGGKVKRIAEHTGFDVPSFSYLSTVVDPEQAFEIGDTIGGYLSELGFNLDFAPCADVLTNPENTVVKDRSFGSDPHAVADLCAAYARGLHAHDVLCTYKHFPGHGATAGDTHEGLAVTRKTLEDMKDNELLPFYRAEEDGADLVMTAHISVPEVLSDNTPCTMSELMLDGVLREECGFQGLIVTDGLNMGAVTERYSPGEAAVAAVLAGNDLLLLPEDLDAAAQGIFDALQAGRLTEERIDASVRRILQVKLQEERVPKEEEPAVVFGDERFTEYLPLLSGKRVALLTNRTGIIGDRIGEDHILDALLSRGVEVTAVFSPEHGFRGLADAGETVENTVDEKTGVPLVSLFGNGRTNPPSDADMERFDICVVDLQDVGVRYFTYYISLYYMMDACAAHGKPMVILDRPNPNGFTVDGPILEEEFKSGVGALPIPVVYGLTWGELSRMINGEGWLTAGKDRVELTVIPCENYTHATKVRLNHMPSPNLKNMHAIWIYASTCYFENTVCSVGRGTPYPFDVYGSPLLAGADGYDFTFTPVSMIGAKEPPFLQETCYGRDLRNVPEETLWENGIDLSYLVDAYHAIKEQHPETDFFKKGSNDRYFVDLLFGTAEVRKAIEAGASASEIEESWKGDTERFLAQRKPYLLYEE